MTKLNILIICLIIAGIPIVSSQNCYALAIEGGGDLGAYEAGVVQGLIQNLPSQDVQWDVFAGISVGSILSVGMGQFPKGQEQAMSEWVISLWQQTSADDVYTNWPGGLVQGLLFEEGLFDTSPLRAYLTSHVTSPMQRKVSIGTTDVNTGNLIRYNESLGLSDIIEAVMSSAAVPAVFPYQQFNGYTFFDGGVAAMIDVVGAIERCLEITPNQENIYLDLLFIADSALSTWSANGNYKTFDVYNRYSKISAYAKAYQEYFTTKALYPNVNYRYVIRPSSTLPDASFPFFFPADQITEMINQGVADAEACIAKGPGGCTFQFEKEAIRVLNERRQVYRRHTKESVGDTIEKLEL